MSKSKKPALRGLSDPTAIWKTVEGDPADLMSGEGVDDRPISDTAMTKALLMDEWEVFLS